MRSVHAFIQRQRGDLPNIGPLWRLVKKRFYSRNRKTSRLFSGYITEEDTKDKDYPLRIVYDDGDEEDVSLADALKIVKESLSALMILNNPPQKDKGYWIFPAYLAKTYCKLHRQYNLDAMDDMTGKSSVAPLFCSKINSVFGHRLDGLSVWCNPDFSKITRFLQFFLKAFERNANTALTVVIPIWLDYDYWPLLKSFRLLDYIPTGTHLFRTPDVYGIRNHGEPCDWGPTRWDVAVLYYGGQYQGHRLNKVLTKAPLQKIEKERIHKVVNLNYMLTGVPEQDALRFSTLRSSPTPDPILEGRSVSGPHGAAGRSSWAAAAIGQQPPLRPCETTK